jgi:hypothetical protein
MAGVLIEKWSISTNISDNGSHIPYEIVNSIKGKFSPIRTPAISNKANFIAVPPISIPIILFGMGHPPISFL